MKFIIKNIKNIRDMVSLSVSISSRMKGFMYFYFNGPLGSGKTFLCKHIINKLSKSKYLVNSPTFTILNSYKILNYYIYHFDMFNINSYKDLKYLDIISYFDRKSICFVEWSDLYSGYFPVSDLYFYIDYTNESLMSRIVKIKSNTSLGDELLNYLV